MKFLTIEHRPQAIINNRNFALILKTSELTPQYTLIQK